MKSRITTLALAFTVGLGMAACASAGGGQGGTQTAEPQEEEEQFPPGTEPSDNMHTRSANLYLDRARGQSDPETKRERFQQALEAAREGIQTDPGNPKAYFQAGRALIGLDQYAAADSMLTRAEEIYPRYQLETRQIRNRAWINLYNPAITQLQQGNTEAAKEALQKANEIYRGRPEALLNLGQIYAGEGETEEAIEAYRSALEIIRGPAFERQNEKTQQQWEKSERIASFNVAQILAQQGDYAEAEKAYRTYIEANPENVQAKTNLAVVLVNQGKNEEAATIYDELLTGTDLEYQDYFNVGIGLFQTGRYERAIDAFRKALELNPYSRDARNNLAQALYQTEQFAPLLSVVERLLEQDPYNRNALAMYTQALLNDGQEEKAQEMYDKHEQLPFEVLGLRLQEQGAGVVLTGRVRNMNAQQGETVEFRFEFVDGEGQVVGEKSVTVELPAQDQAVSFQLALETEADVAGYGYERVGG